MILLTALDACEDKVTGLDLGADDYVVKPFDPRELSARVRAHLRKQKLELEDAGEVLFVGNIVLDSREYVVTCGGEKVALTPKEFQLLEYMIKNKNMILSREQILQQVWKYDYFGKTRYRYASIGCGTSSTLRAPGRLKQSTVRVINSKYC